MEKGISIPLVTLCDDGAAKSFCKGKILVYSHNLKVQGAPLSLLSIVIGYLAIGFEPVVFYSGSKGPLAEEYHKLGVEMVHCSLNNEKEIGRETHVQLMEDILKTISNYSFEAAHINTLLGSHMVVACERIGIPSILNIRESVHPPEFFEFWSRI